ncbi:rubredoxin [Orenia marismortui]|uniref:Rubredoxin n=1 Tax=Orenia marismortui TaxID=46469 RepID=A0A4R8HB71_9FIRM|nr:rubredoxin [Orenia marismortui]TDX53325.1 rubredoxin [Orenia marismortui]
MTIDNKENRKYKCEVCGYTYNPEVGDKRFNLEKGIPFNDLPHNWRCPVCNADKDQFFEVRIS